MNNKQLVCLQIHNDYQISGGETKTAHLIANLLERKGIRVIRYYKTNMEYAGQKGLSAKLRNGLRALNNPDTAKELNRILDENQVDFALIHNVVSVISNSCYKVLIQRNIPIIKYLQNYNLVCLNGALDHDDLCKQCQKNNLIGVSNRCYKDSKLYSFIKYLIKKDMDRHILSHIAAFMPNSEFVMKKHVECGIDGSKMHVMYNYVDIPQIPCEDERREYLYFGRLSNEKGIMTVMDAFAEMPEKKLVIMGSGNLEQEVRRRAEAAANIEYIGSREGKELLDYVSHAKAVIVPSEWDEPLPRTILESYSQGTPVIGSNKGGIPELILEGQTGYTFEAGNVHLLRDAINKMEVMEYKSYMEIRQNCLKRLDTEYTEDAYFRRFMACVNSIISQG